MNRFDKDRTAVSPKSMVEFAESLDQLAAAHRMLAGFMEASGFESVDARNMKTATGGLISLSKFLGAVIEAHADNIAAQGVGELSGALAEISRLTRRKRTIELDAMKLREAAAAAVETARGKTGQTAGQTAGHKPKAKPRKADHN